MKRLFIMISITIAIMVGLSLTPSKSPNDLTKSGTVALLDLVMPSACAQTPTQSQCAIWFQNCRNMALNVKNSCLQAALGSEYCERLYLEMYVPCAQAVLNQGCQGSGPQSGEFGCLDLSGRFLRICP